MKRIVIVGALLVALAGCTDEEGARRHLTNAGYKNIVIDGYAFFGCGQGDGWHTAFRAIAPSGSVVSGVVCDGFMKGATIRFD